MKSIRSLYKVFSLAITIQCVITGSSQGATPLMFSEVSTSQNSISFSIERSNTLPVSNELDLFATTNLAQAAWRWVAHLNGSDGEQSPFELSSSTVRALELPFLEKLLYAPVTEKQAFFILGTLQDTDGDELTDAYELLVLKTDPNNTDSDGDNVPDGWEVLYGLDPKNPIDAYNLVPNGGGLTYREFYKNGLDPNNPPPPPYGADTLLFEFSLFSFASWQMTIQGLGPADTKTYYVVDYLGIHDVSRDLTLWKGNSYLITMQWKGGTYGGANTYDWETYINAPLSVQTYTGSPLAYNGAIPTIVNSGYFIDNSQGLMTSHVMANDSNGGNIAGSLSATLHIPKVDSIKFQNSKMGSSWKTVNANYKHLGVYTGQTVKFGVNTTPANLTIPNGVLTWGGLASGTSAEVNVTFNTKNTLMEAVTVSIGGVTTSANVAVRDVPTGTTEANYAIANLITTMKLMGKNIVNTSGGDLEATVWAASTYPGSQTLNGVGDAARHSYWTCLMARFGSASYALGLSTAHEVSGQPSPSTENAMDLYNNARGVEIATNHAHSPGGGGVSEFQCCRNAIQVALGNGVQWCLDSSHGASNQNEDALLQPTNK